MLAQNLLIEKRLFFFKVAMFPLSEFIFIIPICAIIQSMETQLVTCVPQNTCLPQELGFLFGVTQIQSTC